MLMVNCPNCGAIVNNHKCDYCGAVFVDFMDIEPGQVAYIRIRNQLFKCLCENINIRVDNFSESYVDYAGVHVTLSRPTQTTIETEFITVE